MKKSQPDDKVIITLNSFLLWIGLIVVLIVSLFALFKKSSVTEYNFDTIASEMIKRNFIQNYTTIYPSKIDFKSGSSDESDKYTITFDDDKMQFNCQSFRFTGDVADVTFNLNGGSDIVRFDNKDPSSGKCADYWVFNYDSNAAVYHGDKEASGCTT